MAQNTKPTERLIEGILPGITASRVDREEGVIYGVRLGGLESKNKRRYKESAYREAIVRGEYNDRPCNVNHVEEGQQVLAESRFGMFHNARYEVSPSPGPVADLHYLKAHPLADRVCEAAERPALARTFGMSHIAEAGETSPGADGWLVIESIASVKSIDLVADPATVKGLFEHIEKKTMKDSAKKLIESACNFPFQKRLLEAFCKDEDNSKRITEEVEVPDSAKPVEVANAVFDALAVNVVKDSKLDPQAKANKTLALATLQNKIMNGEEEPAEVKPQPKAPQESVAVGTRKANDICESLKFTPSSKQLVIISEASQANAQAIAEEFCRLSLAQTEKKPEAGGRSDGKQLEESAKPAATAEELAKRIR